MKKLIAIFLIVMISPLSALAGVTSGVDHSDGSQSRVALLKKAAPIEDEFVKSDAFPKVMPVYVKQADPIVDDIVIPYEKSGKTFKIWAGKTGQANKVTIDDELIDSDFISSAGGISVLKSHKNVLIEDDFAKNNAHKNKIAKVKIKNKYDFTKAQVPVHLKIVKALSTKNQISEGDSILFKTTKDVELNGVFLPKGTQVVGRVETISASDKMGCPANIVLDNFYVKDKPEISLYGRVSKTGANRSIWVYPLYQAGNIMFYVAGFIFVPIHGGHAKILSKDTFTVYYESEIIGNTKSDDKSAN